MLLVYSILFSEQDAVLIFHRGPCPVRLHPIFLSQPSVLRICAPSLGLIGKQGITNYRTQEDDGGRYEHIFANNFVKHQGYRSKTIHMTPDPDLLSSQFVIFSQAQRFVNLAQDIGIPEP